MQNTVRMIDIALSVENAKLLEKIIEALKNINDVEKHFNISFVKIIHSCSVPDSPLAFLESLNGVKTKESFEAFRTTNTENIEKLKDKGRELLVAYLEGILSHWYDLKPYYDDSSSNKWDFYKDTIEFLIGDAKTLDYDSLFQLLDEPHPEIKLQKKTPSADLPKRFQKIAVMRVREMTHSEKQFLMQKAKASQKFPIVTILPDIHFISFNTMCHTCRPHMNQMASSLGHTPDNPLVIVAKQKYQRDEGKPEVDSPNILHKVMPQG